MIALVRRAAVVFVLATLLLSLLAQPVLAQGPVHVVQRGETLWSIATRYGTTIDALARTNGLANSRLIYSGQQLTIPTGSGGSGVAPTGGTSVASTGGTYVVRRGDTVSSIAVRHGTTIQAITQANGLANPRLIYVGQLLSIPGGGSSSGGTSGASQPSSGVGGVHVVCRGDTVAAIAYRYGTTIAAIAQANDLSNPS